MNRSRSWRRPHRNVIQCFRRYAFILRALKRGRHLKPSGPRCHLTRSLGILHNGIRVYLRQCY
jgi:hypothetical protein